MPTSTHNVGRDAQLVVVGPSGARLDLNVTEFKWSEKTHELTSRPLNGRTTVSHLPDYTNGSFAIDRNSNVLERLISDRNAAYRGGGPLLLLTMFAYIQEVDGSVTTLRWGNLSFHMSDGGTYKQEDVVRQTIDWTAGDMEIVG